MSDFFLWFIDSFVSTIFYPHVRPTCALIVFRLFSFGTFDPRVSALGRREWPETLGRDPKVPKCFDWVGHVQLLSWELQSRLLKGGLLEVFKYIKTTNKPPLGAAGGDVYLN